MKKRDFKALLLMGLASGALIATQSAGAVETNMNLESTFAGGGGNCGGSGGCGGSNGPQRGGDQGGYYEGYNRPTNSSYQASCSSTRSRQQQNQQYTNKNTRYSRQIAEGDETMPPSTTDETMTPTTPPKAPAACSGKTGCNGKNYPRQYRTRS